MYFVKGKEDGRLQNGKVGWVCCVLLLGGLPSKQTQEKNKHEGSLNFVARVDPSVPYYNQILNL